ncbi:hypothetical protein Anas_06981 [Armadillidium nasatum]|uniref:Uncharacterized protein n=1 Tax=Armadillidium nasatum TaxID=96803 RepID=A0A5N5SMP2_9CRUS|nr:hypothetical protein Anas_06981 [Armadillidium nasatum]
MYLRGKENILYQNEKDAKEQVKLFVKNQKVPYKSMAKSMPLWANIVAHCGNMGGITIFQTQLPIYMDSILGVKIKKDCKNK